MTRHTSQFLFVLLFIVACQCTHFRGGTIAWSVPNDQEPFTVLFTITVYFRTGAADIPVVQSVNLGDGKVIDYPWTRLSSNSEFITQTLVATYTYRSAGKYTVFIGECCRLAGLRIASPAVSGLISAVSLPWKLTTVVTVGRVYDQSPVVTVPPVLNFGVGLNTHTFVTSVPAAFTFSLPTESSLGYSSLPNAAFFTAGTSTVTANPGFTVASTRTTAVLSWRTGTADVGLWASSIKITTATGSITSDFLIRVNNFPVTTARPSVILERKNYSITLGQTVSFSVSCSSTDTTSRFNLSTPVIFPGETINGGTVNVFPNLVGPVNVEFTPVINNGGRSQPFILSFTCTNTVNLLSTTESIIVWVGVPLILNVPQTAYLTCHPRCGCVDVGTANATDGCCQSAVVTFNDKGARGSCNTQFNRTWTATNGCGQSVSIDQIVYVNDDIKPSFTSVPADAVRQCFWETGEENFDVAIAEDICSREVKITVKDHTTKEQSSCKNTLSRVFTATDDCGNYESATQTITVDDTVPPYITIATEAPLKVDCPSQKGFFDSIATSFDDCGLSVLNFSDSADILCGKFTRTFTAVDECGNAAQKDFHLEISHTDKPEITLAPPGTLKCPWQVPLFPAPTAKSFCGYSLTPSLENTKYDHTYNCFSSAARVWSVVDECELSTSVTETITLEDDLPPVITVPEDWTIECVWDPEVKDPYRPELTGGYATATDSCLQNVTITHNDTITIYDCYSVITRAWTATDTCGNSVTRNQKITIADTSVPVFNAPPAFTGECDADINNSLPVDYSTVKDCHPVVITSSDTVRYLKGGACQDKIITRSWKADDKCGHTSTQDQTILIVNEKAPNISVPGDTTVECDISPVDPEDLGYASGKDKCGNQETINITYVDVKWSNNSGFTRVWTVKDSCGNKREESQTVYYNNSMPFIQCPSNVTVPCRASSGVNNTGKATASDNCQGLLKPTYEDTESGTCPTVITRKWSVSETVTGKTGSCIQLITIYHPEGPILKIHDDINVQCEIDARTFTTTGGACSTPFCPEHEVTTPSYEDKYFGTVCTRGRKLVRTWKSNDQCSRVTATNQTINIYDSIKPSLIVPQDVVRKCRLNISTDETGYATAKDNCDPNPWVKYEDSVYPTLTYCPSSVKRVWTAQDCTGNFATGEQTITLNEDAPLFINDPPAVLDDFQCPEDFITRPLKAVDTCGNLIDAVPRVRHSGSCPTVYTIEWTATDTCGRKSVFTQTVKALDTQPPVIDDRYIKDLTVECPSDIPVTGVVTVSDNCKGVIVPEYQDSFPPEDCACDGCSRTIIRKWTAKDLCGNKAIPVIQTIVNRKTKSPVLTTPPDVTVDCGQPTTPDRTGTGLATAEDSCGDKLYVSYKDTTTPGLGGSYLITRTWYTQDNCGHNVSSIQKIRVNPNSNNIVVTPPKPCNLVCGGDKSVDNCGTATVTTTCGDQEALTVVPSMDTACPVEPGVWNRKWEAYRNGVRTGVFAIQKIYVEDCKPIGNGIVNVPQGQVRVSSSRPVTITAGIAITDLDLPCEVITVIWTWGDGTTNTQKCDPNNPTPDRCIFTTVGQTLSLFTSYPHTYSTTGIKNIEVLVTDLRTVDVKPSPVDDGPTWGRFKTRLVLVGTSGAYIAGNFFLQIARIEAEQKRAITGCDSNWIVSGRPTASGGFQTCSCDGSASILFNSKFSIGNQLTVDGQLIFRIAQCCASSIQFVSTTVEHLTIFSDQKSAIFVGKGTYNENTAATFSAFVYSSTSSLGSVRAFYLNVKSTSGVTLLNTDPCFPEVTDWTVLPSGLPRTVVNSDPSLPSDFTVFNPVTATLSAVEDDTSSARTSPGVIAAIVSSLVVFIIIIAVVIFFALRQTPTSDGSFRQM